MKVMTLYKASANLPVLPSKIQYIMPCRIVWERVHRDVLNHDISENDGEAKINSLMGKMSKVMLYDWRPEATKEEFEKKIDRLTDAKSQNAGYLFTLTGYEPRFWNAIQNAYYGLSSKEFLGFTDLLCDIYADAVYAVPEPVYTYFTPTNRIIVRHAENIKEGGLISRADANLPWALESQLRPFKWLETFDFKPRKFDPMHMASIRSEIRSGADAATNSLYDNVISIMTQQNRDYDAAMALSLQFSGKTDSLFYIVMSKVRKLYVDPDSMPEANEFSLLPPEMYLKKLQSRPSNNDGGMAGYARYMLEHQD